MCSKERKVFCCSESIAFISRGSAETLRELRRIGVVVLCLPSLCIPQNGMKRIPCASLHSMRELVLCPFPRPKGWWPELKPTEIVRAHHILLNYLDYSHRFFIRQSPTALLRSAQVTNHSQPSALGLTFHIKDNPKHSFKHHPIRNASAAEVVYNPGLLADSNSAMLVAGCLSWLHRHAGVQHGCSLQQYSQWAHSKSS